MAATSAQPLPDESPLSCPEDTDLDPTPVEHAAAVRWHDDAGWLDGWFLDHGVRWELLRWMPRVARDIRGNQTTKGRVGWQRELLQRQPPPGTRSCQEGREVWLDAVEKTLTAQRWQSRRLQRYRAVAARIAAACPRTGGAITRNGCTHRELAAAADCTEGHISSIVAWLVAQGLLFIVVPGKHMPRLPIPEDERPEELAERLALAAAIEERGRRRQQLLDEHGPDAVVDLAELREQLGPAPARTSSRGTPLIAVAQVYELRIPEAPESPVLPAAAWGARISDELTIRRQRRARARLGTLRKPQPVARAAAAAGVHPANSDPSVFQDHVGRKEPPSAAVEKRAAAPRSYEDKRETGQGRNRPGSRAKRPLAAAERLLDRTGDVHAKPEKGTVLPPQLRKVGVRWLAARIAPYVMAGLTDQQLVLLIAYGGGEYEQCPPVEFPHGFIAAALARHSPDVPFRHAKERQATRSVAEAVGHKNAQAALRRENRIAEAARRRGECGRCDEDGWTLLDGGEVEVLCDHTTGDDVDQALDAEGTPVPPSARQKAREDFAASRAERDALRSELLDQAQAARAGQGKSQGTGYRPRSQRHRLPPVVAPEDLVRTRSWFTRSPRT